MAKKKVVKSQTRKPAAVLPSDFSILAFDRGNGTDALKFFQSISHPDSSNTKGWYCLSNFNAVTDENNEKFSTYGVELRESESIFAEAQRIAQAEEGKLILMIDSNSIAGGVNWGKLFQSRNKLSALKRNGFAPYIKEGRKKEFLPIVVLNGNMTSYLLETASEDSEPWPVFLQRVGRIMPSAFTQVKKDSVNHLNNVHSLNPLKGFMDWFIISPFSDFKRGVHKRFDFMEENPLYRFGFFMFFLVSLLLMTSLSQNAGISGDEYRYITQAERVYNYYATFGSDKAAVSQTGIDPQHYNAQTFDNVMFAAQKWMGLESESFGFRHFWNSVIGWLTILFTSLIALRLGGGYRLAILVGLLLLLSPRFLGHSYNNHRDIPIAAAVVFTFYWMIPFIRSLPKLNRSAAIWVALGIASAYSLRMGGGILLTGYLMVFTALIYMWRRPVSKWFSGRELSLAGNMGFTALVVAFIGYVIGLLTWPFGLESPLKHTLEVIDATSNIGVSLRQTFEGEELFSTQMPWYYVPKYMLITIPSLVLFAFILGLFNMKTFLNSRRAPFFLMALAAIILPLYYACFQTNNHYGGWRHFIFIYPFVVLFAGFGIESLFKHIKKPIYRIGLWVIVILGLFHPIKYIVNNHPYEYIYYNEIIGGVSGAYGNFETDYSLNSLRESNQWLIDNVLVDYRGEEKLRIATNDRLSTKYYLRNYTDVAEVVYTRYYEKTRSDWDYAVFFNSYISPDEVRTGIWPPVETVYPIMADNAIIGAVVKRVSKLDYEGHQKMEAGEPIEALNLYLDYLDLDPNNVEIWTAISDAYLFAEEYEGALSAANVALQLHPGYIRALQYKGGALLNLERYQESVETFDQLLAEIPHHFMSHYYKAAAHFRMGNFHEAIESATDAIAYNPNLRMAYMLLAESYYNIGDEASAQRIMRIMEERTDE